MTEETEIQDLPQAPLPEPETLAPPQPERLKTEVQSIDDTEPEVPPFTLEDVGRFAYERQAIWHRRFVQELPAPWTEDETLQSWRICNIYRELDKGTQYARQNVAERRDESGELYPQRDRLINAIVYRMLNMSESWERHVGWLEPPYDDAIRAAGERLANAAAEGEVIRTNAFRASALTDFIRSCVAAADQLDELHAMCEASNSLKMVHAVISRGCDIGDFTAYQVVLDLKFVYPNLDNDDWVMVYGRGTRRKDGHGGSMWMFKHIDSSSDPIDVARHLRDTQDEWLPPEWAEVAWPERPRLALVDVDNVACEFRKYWLKRHGQGSLRRYGDEPEPVRRRRNSSGGRRGVSANWETPPALFAQLHEEFGFTVDAAASAENTKVERYWSVADDGLRQSWAGERVFAYPPSNDCEMWTQKAVAERERAETIVMLLPAALETINEVMPERQLFDDCILEIDTDVVSRWGEHYQ